MLTYWIYRTIAAIPLRLLYLLSPVLAWLVHRVFQYRRNTVATNLRNAFPDESDTWHAATQKKFYKQLADVTLEAIYGWRMSQVELESRVSLKGWDALVPREGETPAPAILLSIHHANWEWLLQRASLAVAAPFDGVYKPLHDAGAERFALESRSKYGATLVTLKTISRHVLKSRKQPRVLALLADQSPSKTEPKRWIKFLNQPTAFFSGPATLARLTLYPVYFVRTTRTARGRYEIELLDICINPDECTPDELVLRYAQLAEETIRMQPENYLWSNRRWKLKAP